MINGIGVVAWGVGGIEAEAGMLGQPVYFLTPDVVGFDLTGRLREGVTATDLVLTVTELLRKPKVVGKFVEFFGAGASSLTVADRAPSPIWRPNTARRWASSRSMHAPSSTSAGTGRDRSEVAAFEAYFKAQGLFGMPSAGDIDYTDVVKLDLDHGGAEPGRARSARRTASTSRT